MQGRKRVVSREVRQVEAANRQAALMPPAEVLPPMSVATPTSPFHERAHDAPTVVDPTTLGRRHRRSSHHRVYRWAQGCSMLGALLAAVSVICTMADDIALSRSLAGAGLALGVISILLSGRNELAARWRGWTIAATVFAAVALSLTWILPTVIHDDPSELVPKQRLRSDA